MPLRPEGAATAAHIIGPELVIRLLPKLDLTSFPCSNAAAQRCHALSRFEVHGKSWTLPVTDVRTELILLHSPAMRPKVATFNEFPWFRMACFRPHRGERTGVNYFCVEHLTSTAVNFATRKTRCGVKDTPALNRPWFTGNMTCFLGI